MKYYGEPSFDCSATCPYNSKLGRVGMDRKCELKVKHFPYYDGSTAVEINHRNLALLN